MRHTLLPPLVEQGELEVSVFVRLVARPGSTDEIDMAVSISTVAGPLVGPGAGWARCAELQTGRRRLRGNAAVGAGDGARRNALRWAIALSIL